MENNNRIDINSETTANRPEAISETLTKNRGIIKIAFALVIIFFFFSFCDFKCSGVKVASLTGFNLVTGSEIKMENPAGIFNDRPFGSVNGRGSLINNQQQKIESNIWAILALLSAIGGVVVYYRKIKNEALIGFVLGAAGFLSLLLLRAAITEKLQEQGGGMLQVQTDFLFGYWASVISFMVAGIISYLCYRQEKKDKLIPTKKSNTENRAAPLHVNIIMQEQPGSS